jgi:hypothetical protein
MLVLSATSRVPRVDAVHDLDVSRLTRGRPAEDDAHLVRPVARREAVLRSAKDRSGRARVRRRSRDRRSATPSRRHSARRRPSRERFPPPGSRSSTAASLRSRRGDAPSASGSQCSRRPRSWRSARRSGGHRQDRRECRPFRFPQLHQLRGRVGRGARPSYCILPASDDAGPDALARLASCGDLLTDSRSLRKISRCAAPATCSARGSRGCRRSDRGPDRRRRDPRPRVRSKGSRSRGESIERTALAPSRPRRLRRGPGGHRGPGRAETSNP